MMNRRSGSLVGMLALLPTLVSLLMPGGCASNQPATGSGGIRAITEAEIQTSDAEDVLELIQRLRPVWLAGSLIGDPRDPTVAGGPTVLINDIPPKPLHSLQFLSLENIREIHYLTRTNAETRFRVGAVNGLILVLTHSPVVPRDTLPPDTGASSAPSTAQTTSAQTTSAQTTSAQTTSGLTTPAQTASGLTVTTHTAFSLSIREFGYE